MRDWINFDNEQVSPFADNMSKEFGEYGIIIMDAHMMRR